MRSGLPLLRRRAGSLIAVTLSATLSLTNAGSALASGQSSSGSSSGGDSASSKGSNSSNGSGDSSNSSNDSSKTSAGTSDDSRASSNDSDQSTQNSPKNSTDYTTHHSSEWTTKTRDGQVFAVAVILVCVGATVLGLVAGNATQRAGRQQAATAALAETMRRHHPLFMHDLSTGKGPVLAALAHDLRLGRAEQQQLQAALEGSAEQTQLLDALDGKIDETRARRFGAAFVRLAERALGEQRTHVLAERALRAVGAI